VEARRRTGGLRPSAGEVLSTALAIAAAAGQSAELAAA
jgi:hypothetical protein